ncbi:hypothetical protein N0614_09585 [Pseudomonas aeruginosa]|nr:hypothetical protein [Pseudomonas aeruginosa]
MRTLTAKINKPTLFDHSIIALLSVAFVLAVIVMLMSVIPTPDKAAILSVAAVIAAVDIKMLSIRSKRK